MKRIKQTFTTALLLLATLLVNPAFSQTDEPALEAPAIGGYSPVSYFTKNIAEIGSPEFAVEHNGSVYHLTSEDQIRVFEKDPDKYRPKYKSCPYSLALGKVLPLDPTNFKIIGDQLLLFHLSDDEDALLLWNDSEISEAELTRRADANLFLVEF